MFLKHARNPMFLGMGNHLEPFSKVSEPPEGQEQGGGAVGGQGRLQGVKLSYHTIDIILRRLLTSYHLFCK